MTAPVHPTTSVRPLVAAPLLATRPGDLPHDGPAVVGTTSVPAGHRCRGRRSERPVLWVTDEPVEHAGAMCRALQQEFSVTGLWPVVLEPLHAEGESPWDSGNFFAGDPARIDAASILDVFEERWELVGPDAQREPHGTDGDAIDDPVLRQIGADFPGLAHPNGHRRDRAHPDGSHADGPHVDGAHLDGAGLEHPIPVPSVHDALAQALDHVGAEPIGLVPAVRPADVIALLAWHDHDGSRAEPWQRAAILRSWEERFGAVVVGVGATTVDVSVAAPPTTFPDAIATAIEHYAFAPCGITQGVGTIEAYAEQILGAKVWSFWWD